MVMCLLLKNLQSFFKKFTLDKKEEVEELIRLKQILSIPQRFSTGEVMGYFFAQAKRKKRLWQTSAQNVEGYNVHLERCVQFVEWQQMSG